MTSQTMGVNATRLRSLTGNPKFQIPFPRSKSEVRRAIRLHPLSEPTNAIPFARQPLTFKQPKSILKSMKCPSRWFLAILAVTILMGISPARAVLILEFDPTAFTFRFLGTDTGTPNPNSGAGRTDWSQPFSLSNATNNSVSLDTAISSNEGLSPFTTSLLRIQGSAASPGFAIEIFTSTANLQTLTGTGTPVSYANWTTTQKSDLESFVTGGGQFPLVFGASFESILTQVVPEPGTLGLLALTATLGGVAVLRRRRTHTAL